MIFDVKAANKVEFIDQLAQDIVLWALAPEGTTVKPYYTWVDFMEGEHLSELVGTYLSFAVNADLEFGYDWKTLLGSGRSRALEREIDFSHSEPQVVFPKINYDNAIVKWQDLVDYYILLKPGSKVRDPLAIVKNAYGIMFEEWDRVERLANLLDKSNNLSAVETVVGYGANNGYTVQQIGYSALHSVATQLVTPMREQILNGDSVDSRLLDIFWDRMDIKFLKEYAPYFFDGDTLKKVNIKGYERDSWQNDVLRYFSYTVFGNDELLLFDSIPVAKLPNLQKAAVKIMETVYELHHMS